MSHAPATPRRPTQSGSSGGVSSRIASSTVHASPHYVTTRRHSLYGVEDRIIIDPGSRIWKVGFSGEGRPRDVFYATGENGPPLWTLLRSSNNNEREEADRILAVRMETLLRSVFHNSLLTDPKARKVILVEHPLLPHYIKEVLAKTLFENLQVPSVSFASSHLLALCSTGRITGLVIDSGHLESTVLPIFAARPLFHHLKTTPLGGERLAAHIQALLILFGTYYPPPTSLMAAANIPRESRSSRVPEEVLTHAVIEQIKTRCVFVGQALPTDSHESQLPSEEVSDSEMAPPSDFTPSESDFSQTGRESNFSSSQHPSSEFSSVVSHSHVPTSTQDPNRVENHLQALEKMYKRHSNATDIYIRVMPPPTQQTGTGLGTLLVPGWIRERAAEVLFEGGDVDESSLPETVLDALLKVPVDLRITLASSIMVAGGTSMLPGFTSRLYHELLRTLEAPIQPLPTRPIRRGRPPPPVYDRYAPLRPLMKYFAILNSSSLPPPKSERAVNNAGRSPAFTPAIASWVGGSLAGSLKTGGIEVSREKWDEANSPSNLDDDLMIIDPKPSSETIIPDWTRITASITAAG